MMVQVSSSQSGLPSQPVPQRRIAKRAKSSSSAVHLSEQALQSFCEQWFSNPETVAEETFDTIQLHLLGCKVCASMAKRYEDMYIMKAMRVSAA